MRDRRAVGHAYQDQADGEAPAELPDLLRCIAFAIANNELPRDRYQSLFVTKARIRALAEMPRDAALAEIERERAFHVDWATRLHDFLVTEVTENAARQENQW